jgi:hypothetical protein
LKSDFNFYINVNLQCAGAIVGAGLAHAVAGSARFDASQGGTNALSAGVSVGQAVLGEVSGKASAHVLGFTQECRILRQCILQQFVL